MLSLPFSFTYDWAILNLNWPCKKSDVLHGQKCSILPILTFETERESMQGFYFQNLSELIGGDSRNA